LSAPDSLLSLNSNNEAFQKFSMKGLIASLQDCLATTRSKSFSLRPAAISGRAAGSCYQAGCGNSQTLSTVIAQILAPLLDPVLNQLLGLLGIDLAQAELEGRMDCGTVALVY
jgi:hypothetical protein